MPRCFSISIQSEVAWRALLRAFTVPAMWIAPEKSSSFSVSVVFPASGCEMMAKVLRRATSRAICGSLIECTARLIRPRILPRRQRLVSHECHDGEEAGQRDILHGVLQPHGGGDAIVGRVGDRSILKRLPQLRQRQNGDEDQHRAR